MKRQTWPLPDGRQGMTSGQHHRNLQWQDVTAMGQFSGSTCSFRLVTCLKQTSLVTLVLPVRSINPVLPLMRPSSELVCNEIKEHPACTLYLS